MKLVLIDKSGEQKAEILVERFRGNLVEGIIAFNSFNVELKKKIAHFENIVNTQQFSILDEVTAQLDAYGWEVCAEKWTVFDFQVFNKVDISFRIKELNSSLEEKDIDSKLDELGYDNRWLMYKYLTIGDLNKQYSLYLKAVTNTESVEAENGFQHTEHLRYGQFYRIAGRHKSFTNKQLEELIELVECDDDQVMATNFYYDIMNQNKVTAAQIERFKEL